MMAAHAQQPGMTLGELLAGIVPVSAAQDCRITGLALDSRKVRRGDLFLACAGQNTDGRRYIAQAVQAGAVAVLAQGSDSSAVAVRPDVPVIAIPELARQAGLLAARFYGEPARELQVIGVTGTNGKTSVACYLAQALAAAGERCGILGTLGYGIYDEPLAPAVTTTPDPIAVHAWLNQWREQHVRYAVMEVSSHALAQHRVNGVVFQSAVFTNLSRDHLDYHADLQQYAAAKRRLFFWPGLGHAIINLDDPCGRALAGELPPGPELIGYGLQAADAGIRGIIRQLDATGLRLSVQSPAATGELQVPLAGEFNASNLLAAVGVLLGTGMSLSQALQCLAAARPAPGRLQQFGGGEQALVVVDYAHTPAALEQALLTLRPLCRGRLCCVFGCGGDRDRGKRPDMGAIAERLADVVVLTSDNPRNEDPVQIIADIQTGLQQPGAAQVETDRAAAIASAIAAAAAGDVVLIAGKGHESWQEIAGVRYPYSDQQQVQACLQRPQ